MALIGSVTGSVRAQKLDFGSSNAILTASNSGENLIMSSSNLFISSSAYMSGAMTINQPGGVSGITLQSAGGGVALNMVAAQGSAFNSDLYVGNNKTPFPDLWTFSYRGLDNSFLFFSYNGGAFLNSLKLFTNGGVGIGPVAATANAPGTNVIYTNNAFGIGTGLTAPTARIHIVGGSDSGGAPLRLNSGSLLTSPLSGSIEFNGTNLFVTSGTTRQTILTTLTNNAAVTSSFLVSTASDMTLRVPGAAGETSRSVIVTSNRTPTPTLGSDTFLFISGATSSKGTATRGTAVLAGDVVVSGTLHGGVQFGSSTGLTIQANKVQVTANTLSFGQSGGSDIGFFVSGSIGSRGVANSGGTSLFGGDLYASGVSYFANGLSGSLTRLSDGTSYLVAGANVTITTGSNGAVTIASTGGGGGTPGGSDTQIQFNDGGSFGGDADLTFNKTTNVLGATVIDAGNKSVTVTGITGAMVVRGGPNAPGLFGAGSQTVHLVGTGSNGSGAGIVFGDYSATYGVGIFEDTDNTMLVESSNRMRVESSGQNVEVRANTYVDIRSNTSYVSIAPTSYASISPATPTIGDDVFLYVTGTSNSKGTATRGTAVFAGDVVVSGTIFGGVNPISPMPSTDLVLRGDQVKITKNALSFGQFGGQDVAVFVSGTVNGKNSGGVSLIGGDTVISGSLYLEKAVVPTVVSPVTNSVGSSPNSTGFITSSLALGNIFRVTLTNNTGSFLAPTSAKDGQQATWIVKQDSTGTRLGVWASGSNGFAWPGGVAPTLSTSASAVDMVTAQYDGSSSRWFATFAKGFV